MIYKTLVYKISRAIGIWFWQSYMAPLVDPFTGLKFRLREIVTEHRFENALGIETWGNSRARGTNSVMKDDNGYAPAEYIQLDAFFPALESRPDDIFMDIGCGKGRVIFYMAQKPFRKVIGVEYAEALVNNARKNLQNLRHRSSPIEIIHDDAVNVDLREPTIFFFYNPFRGKTFERVLENIRKSLDVNPRPIKLVFYFAGDEHIDLLSHCDWLTGKGGVGIFIPRRRRPLMWVHDPKAARSAAGLSQP